MTLSSQSTCLGEASGHVRSLASPRVRPCSRGGKVEGRVQKARGWGQPPGHPPATSADAAQAPPGRQGGSGGLQPHGHVTLAAAAAAKSLQSCPTLCDPIDGSPPGSPALGILQARTLEWVAISFSNAWKWKVKVKALNGVWLLVTPWTAAYQASPSMGFSRQEYYSGVPLPSPDSNSMGGQKQTHPMRPSQLSQPRGIIKMFVLSYEK